MSATAPALITKSAPTLSVLEIILATLHRLECEDRLRHWKAGCHEQHETILETHEIIVAPTRLITGVTELNEFMNDLVTEISYANSKLTWSYRREFRGSSKHHDGIFTGLLCFDQSVRVCRTERLALVKQGGQLPLSLQSPAFRNGVKSNRKIVHLAHRTQIQFFPHVCFAKNIMTNGGESDFIPFDRLPCDCPVEQYEAA